MKFSPTIRPMQLKDLPYIIKIYEQGIKTGNATFETKIMSKVKWNKIHLRNCRFVAELNNKIVGWAALSSVSNRDVYKGVAEVSVYVDIKFIGKNIGRKLIEKLISESEKKGIWTLQATIFPENFSSIKVHSKLGFRKVGIRKKIGKMNEIWRDTILYEKRSKIVN